MGVFDALPSELANDAVDEFIRLLQTRRLYDQMATVFTEAGPAAQKC
jgi:hypothetical protein